MNVNITSKPKVETLTERTCQSSPRRKKRPYVLYNERTNCMQTQTTTSNEQPRSNQQTTISKQLIGSEQHHAASSNRLDESQVRGVASQGRTCLMRPERASPIVPRASKIRARTIAPSIVAGMRASDMQLKHWAGAGARSTLCSVVSNCESARGIRHSRSTNDSRLLDDHGVWGARWRGARGVGRAPTAACSEHSCTGHSA